MRAKDAIDLFAILTKLEWRDLNDQDHMTFAGAGPEAKIAEVSETRTAELNELLDSRSAYPFLALIGGDEDEEQLELHGMTSDGDPIALMMTLKLTEA